MTIDNEEITVAADIGGTHMRSALVTAAGKIIHREEQPTPRDATTTDALTDLIRSVANNRHNLLAPTTVIIGLPGQVDYAAGRLLSGPNLPPTWHAQLSEQQLTNKIGLPVRIANDADVAAVGEAYFGAGRDHRDVAYITVSTGIGAGLVYSGQLIRGARSLAELGHTIIDREAEREDLPATLEEIAAGSGMARMASAAGLGSITGEKIDELKQKGDERATKIWSDSVFATAIGITNLITCFSPELVVLGGGIGLQQEYFAALTKAIEHMCIAHPPAIPMVQAVLGDNAGLIGCARWLAATL